MQIACAQIHPILGDTSANKQLIENVITATKSDLIIFPELAVTGYAIGSFEEVQRLAMTSDDPYFESIRDLCRERQTAVVIGFAEKNNGSYYNSAILIDASGSTIGIYRKVHLFYYESVLFKAGSGFTVYPIVVQGDEVRIGMMICYDWRFPEAARTLALQGADIIAVPSNIVTESSLVFDTLRIRAFENKVIVAFADRIGSETAHYHDTEETLTFRGQSMIINYNGQVISEAENHQYRGQAE